MPTITRPCTFVDGRTDAGKITAQRLNDNLDEVFDLVNGLLDEDNVDPAGEICTSGKANSFTAKQTFGAGTDHSKAQAQNFNIEQVAGLPSWVSADKGRLVYNTVNDGLYIGGASGWVLLEGNTPADLRVYAFTGIADINDDLFMTFKTKTSPTLRLSLKGAIFPKRYYTELGQHTHSITDTGHTHDVAIGSHGHGATQYALSTHTHGVTGDTGNQSAIHSHSISLNTGSDGTHYHSGVTPGGGDTHPEGSHTHTVSGNSGNQSVGHTHAISLTSGTPSASGAVASADLGTKTSTSVTAGIGLGNAGVNGGTLASALKDYAHSLKVYIDATEITAGILAATGWGAIGDGTSGHAFHTTGTGELDISALVSLSAGLHTLRIQEPTAGKGCRIQVHLETL